jgi:hypothetical protein
MSSSVEVLFGDDAHRGDDAFDARLSSLEVEEHADLPGALEMTLKIAAEGPAGAEDLPVVGDEDFKPYGRIAVVVGIDGKSDACIFDGYVLSHKIQLDKGTTTGSVRVWGQDASCLLNLVDNVREWSGADSTIADTIFRDNDITASPDNARDDNPKADGQTIMQRATDAQFLRDRARRTGKLFRICCDQQAGQNTGYFIKPPLSSPVTATLILNPPDEANIDSLAIDWDVARPTEVLAQTLELASEKAADGGATDSGLSPPPGAQSLASFIGEHVMKTRLTAAVADAGELQRRSASLLCEAGWFVRCEGEADVAKLGTVLRAARMVEVAGAGSLHSGNYLVWSVRHLIVGDSHKMKFVLVRNSVGG